jgi:hypothetical protein
MKSVSTVESLVIAVLTMASLSAIAAVTPQEADKLGKELTAIGAEKAGNADGSISAYEGNDTPLAGWEWGKNRFDYWKYKGDKPLFSIDGSNVDKYAAHLTDSQIQALKTIKGYRMDVYPTRRTCAVPALLAERTKANAAEAKIGADGWSLEHAKTAGVPFPIPKTGVEVMYNARVRPQSIGVTWNDGTSIISPRAGSDEFTHYQWLQYFYYPTQNAAKASMEADGNVEVYGFYIFSKPPGLAGQGLVTTAYMNRDPEQSYYFPGQRRVRRLPTYVFDTPFIGYENQYLIDEQLMQWSTLDRFEYKLVGKKEIYVPVNGFRMFEYKADPKTVFEKTFINPDFRRYELRRVWVVDATIKPSYRHLAPHRIYYIDEDSWNIVTSTDFDHDGKVWKLLEGFQVPAWEIGGICVHAPTEMWDLQNGRYVVDWMSIGGGKDVKWIKEGDPEAKAPWVKPDFYTPETLRSLSER